MTKEMMQLIRKTRDLPPEYIGGTSSVTADEWSDPQSNFEGKDNTRS